MLSPRFIWMASKETDQFTTRPTTFVDAEGIEPEVGADIAASTARCATPRCRGPPASFGGSANTLYALAAQLSVLAYFNLGGTPANWRRGWRRTGRSSPAWTWTRPGTQPDNKGVLAEYKPRTARGGHAVAIVGYRPGEVHRPEQLGHRLGDKGFRVRLGLVRRERVHRGTAAQRV